LVTLLLQATPCRRDRRSKSLTPDVGARVLALQFMITSLAKQTAVDEMVSQQATYQMRVEHFFAEHAVIANSSHATCGENPTGVLRQPVAMFVRRLGVVATSLAAA
jgi:hypothetical protein